MKVIFEVSHLSFVSRVTWALAVLTALALFTYINVINVQRFLSYPKAVNVEVNHLETLPFPAVTLCNYNHHTWVKRFHPSVRWDAIVWRRHDKRGSVHWHSVKFQFYHNFIKNLNTIKRNHYFRLTGLVDLRLYENVLEYYSNHADDYSSDTSGKSSFHLTQDDSQNLTHLP